MRPKYRFGCLRGPADAGWPWAMGLRVVMDGQVTDAAVLQEGGDENVRFRARLPVAAYDGSAHQFAIGTAAGEVLTDTAEFPARALTSRRYDGHLVAAGGLAFSGWVQDAADPDSTVELEATLDGVSLGTFEADEPRRGVVKLFGGNTYCGFTVRLEPDMLHEREQELVVMTSDGQVLRGFPKMVSIDEAIRQSRRAIERLSDRARHRLWDNTQDST